MTELSERLDAVVEAALGHRIVGSVTLVARDGNLVYARAAGWQDREADVPMQRDCIFRLASVTKPMVVTTALAMIERELLGLDQAVSDHLPYFRTRLSDGREAPILIRHLLTHTSGLGYDFSADPLITTGSEPTEMGFEENFSRVAALPLAFEPGSQWQYGLSTDVLGAVVASVHGGTLADAVHHYVAGPLEMTDAGFEMSDHRRLAVPYANATPQPRRMRDVDPLAVDGIGIVPFAPARIFSKRAFQSAGAGAVGTANDILKLLETLRTGGGAILRPETVAMATSNQIGDLPRGPGDAGQRFGFFGAVIDDPVAARSPQGAGTFRWGGSYGHEWSVDPRNGLTILSMTNTAPEGCYGSYPMEVRDAVYGALAPV